MKLPSKEITKTVAKKKKVTKPKCEVKAVPEVVIEVKESPLGKYELKTQMNNEVMYVYGEDGSIFSMLDKPTKYTTKAVFTLTNMESGKSFEVAYPPFLARKLLNNKVTQIVQWKRLSSKVA